MADDPFLTYDAAYVLGALTPDERRDYRQHLNKCDRCTIAVGELAGLPGLLARSDPTRSQQTPPQRRRHRRCCLRCWPPYASSATAPAGLPH